MKICFNLMLCLISFTSCKESFRIPTEQECNSISVEALETVEDFKKNFTVELPYGWETKLYYDDFQSTIYTADTTKQLTSSILIDFTFINQNIALNDLFSLKQEQLNLQENLIKKEAYRSFIESKEVHHAIYIGKKKEFLYQKHIIHIKFTAQQFVVATIELYGDQFLAERSCRAIAFVESLKLSS